MGGAAPRAALARASRAGKLSHFDINNGYRLKHDADIAVGLANPLDWLNILLPPHSHGYNVPFNLDYKPPRTTSNYGTLWEMAGKVISGPVLKEAAAALKAGGGVVTDALDAESTTAANRELLTLRELISRCIVKILCGL